MAQLMRQRISLNGQEKWVSGHSQKELVLNTVDVVMKTLPVSSGVLRSPTFREYCELWWKVYCIHRVKDTTARNYRIELDKHILPHLGTLEIASITASDLQSMFNATMDYSKSTHHHMKVIIGMIFDSAIEDGLTTRNPARSKRLVFSKKEKTRNALTMEAFQDIQQHLHMLAAEDRMMLGLLMYSGMRRGEMLAMCWENIDFANNEINVREAVSYRNGMPRLGLPKSKAGIRKIPLDFRLKALLIPQRQITGFVIGESLTPLAEKAFQRRWRRIAETIDLHGATPHVFRHTYISIAVAAGVDPKTVQAIAGHADIETTLEVYAHVRQKSVEEAGEKISLAMGHK